eukprot:6178462-Pleurochrysis_carterae.AAC.1
MAQNARSRKEFGRACAEVASSSAVLNRKKNESLVRTSAAWQKSGPVIWYARRTKKPLSAPYLERSNA